MTAKEYLLQAKNLDDYINAKLREAAQLRSRIINLQGVSYDKDSVKGGRVHNFTDAVDSLIKLEQYIDTQINRLVSLKKEIGDKINIISDNRLKTVLARYYLCNEQFETIAEEMNYSKRQVLRLHGLALEEFRKMYSKMAPNVT